ncbi:MAG: hypothetical protein HQ512_10990 [Rhodospirillales bacterium]|nr:hypothetical protein [Rhodospirillales bacterium]
MSRLLISDEYPHSHQLDAVFDAIRREIVKGRRRNMKALDMLKDAKNTLEEIFCIAPPKQRVPVSVADPVNRRLGR